MSEEQLNRIESKIDLLASGQVELVKSVARLEVRLVRVEARLDKIEARLGKVEARLGKVEVRSDNVEATLEGVDDHIKLLSEAHSVSSAATERAFEGLSEHLAQRLQRVELTVLDHSAILKAHNLTRLN